MYVVWFVSSCSIQIKKNTVSTVDWIRSKIASNCSNRTTCALYKAYTYYTYVSKNCAEQCL